MSNTSEGKSIPGHLAGQVGAGQEGRFWQPSSSDEEFQASVQPTGGGEAVTQAALTRSSSAVTVQAALIARLAEFLL